MSTQGIIAAPRRLIGSLLVQRLALALLLVALWALAAHSGISASMISDIERGAKSPTIATLAVLAAALGVPLATLVEPPSPAPSRIRVVRGAEIRPVIDPVHGARRESFGSICSRCHGEMPWCRARRGAGSIRTWSPD